jgi:hypothetical protein
MAKRKFLMENGLMNHQIIILESKIQDTIQTCFGYLRLKLETVNTKYGRIHHRVVRAQ